MVALQSRRRPFRSAALVICLLLAAPLLAPLTAAQEDEVSYANWLLKVNQGELRVTENGRPVFFVANQSQITIAVPVWNHGNTTTEEIPVYFWYDEPAIDPGYAQLAVGCVNVVVPRAELTSGGFVPRMAWANWTTGVPVNWPARGYNVSVLVNELPDGVDEPAAGRWTSAMKCADPKHQNRLPGAVTGTIDPAGPHHRAKAFFVKDLRPDLQVNTAVEVNGIRWCSQDPRTSADPRNGTGCSTTPPAWWDEVRYPSTLYNRTVHAMKVNPDTRAGQPSYVPNDNDQPVWFQVNVKNEGTWRWLDLQDPAAPEGAVNNGVPYRVSVTASGFNISGSKVITLADATPNGAGWQTVGKLSLRELGGVYRINVTLDSLNNHTEASPTAGVNAEANNAGQRDFEVQWLDFSAAFNETDFKTTPADPYPHLTEFSITGDVVVRNHGKAPLIHPESNTSALESVKARMPWRVRIAGTDHVQTGSFANDQDPSTPSVIDWSYGVVKVDFRVSSIVGAHNYLAPGKHKLIVEADWGNLSHETNERNNIAELDIYVQDTTAPRILGGPWVTNEHPDTNLSVVRPKDGFNVRARITDDNIDSLDVRVNFSLATNRSVYRHYEMNRTLGTQNSFFVHISNFTFHGEGHVQNWTYTLEVNDSFGNLVNTSTSPRNLRVDKWPVQGLPATGVVREPAEERTFEYSSVDPVSYVIKVLPEWTGLTNAGPQNQRNVTHNLFMWVSPNGGAPINISGGWASLTRCTPVSDVEDPTQKLTGDASEPVYSCNVANPQDFSHFKNTVSAASGKPGRWNVSIGIVDKSGEMRLINRTLVFTDAAPTPVRAGILDLNLRETDSVNASQPLRIVANFSDDRSEQVQAYANFTRVTDGKWVNYTLTPRAAVGVPDANGTMVPHFNFNDTLETGIGKAFGLGGEFNVTIAAVDGTGNWAHAPAFRFKVNDTGEPRLFEAKVVPSVQEVGQNVTFTARGWDETNMTLRVSILLGDREVVTPVTLTSEDGTNFTWSTQLGVEGNYRWEMVLRDSVGRPVDQSGTLAIRQNLGPRFELLSPSAKRDNTVYGPAAPRIEVLAYDSDSVDANSITMTVDDVPVVPELGPAPAGITGVTLSYQVPPGARFAHGERVWVNVTAADGSAKQLPGSENFTFRVDDVAPTTRVASYEPQHRNGANHVMNVSLNTRFTLEATDEDGVPTGVAAIRYRILAGGANSGENLYTGPFRINDAPGVYRGPLLYYVHAWAEDDVGNVNKTPVILAVYVDDAPPDIIQYFPQGRYVNATFVDDRVGVARAAVMHRVNAEPYRELPLQPDAGNLWKGVLPEARKGDRVSYYLQAWDHLNNTQTFGNATHPYVHYNATNHDPRVRIVSPATGARLGATFNLEWEASDEDLDALVFTVGYKAPGRTGYTELAKLDQPDIRRYPVDSRKLQDGEYTFRVSANDGGVVKHSEIQVQIINRADAIVGVSPITETVTAGGSVLLKAQIAKAEAVVEARLHLRGELVASFPMNDDGRDGDETANDHVYSVRADIPRSGDYSVEIFTRYQEDGELRTSSMKDAVSFSAKMTPAYIMREYTVLLVLIALAAAVAVGAAAWLVMRKRG